jgi:hypothetical protein
VKKVYLINGVGGVGKDSFCSFCSEYISTLNISSVDKIKEAARILGWNGDKDEKSRKFLADLKYLSTDYNNNPYEYIKRTIEYFRRDDTPYGLMFIHVREPNEIHKIKTELNCETILVRNKNVRPITSNTADANVENYEYDYVINNDGTLDDLKETARRFVCTYTK